MYTRYYKHHNSKPAMNIENTNFQIPIVSVTTPHASTTMPLVVPGLMSKGGDNTSDWQNKLMGKKIGDSGDEMV
jgi:hypothetical protein